MRTFTAVLGNSQRLDGGAMFGNAPKAVWQKWIAPDGENRIPLACRAMLVEDDGRRVLFETGIGSFFEPKLRERFGVVETRHVLLENLAALGVAEESVDTVVLSHLHFDHAGGLLTPYREGHALELAFSRAEFVVSEAAWARAKAPHARDRASFIPELTGLLESSGRLRLVPSNGPLSSDGSVSSDGRTANGAASLGDGYRFHFSEGHTPGLMLTEVALADGPVVFAGDLIPGVPWVHVPITMGYDRYPEKLIEEKERLLTDLAARGGRLFFTHDAQVAVGRVARDDRGKFYAADVVASPVRAS
jgi:glyoxylase-like metal-dependent hydrolase (beta-lactamase superfamily II)